MWNSGERRLWESSGSFNFTAGEGIWSVGKGFAEKIQAHLPRHLQRPSRASNRSYFKKEEFCGSHDSPAPKTKLSKEVNLGESGRNNLRGSNSDVFKSSKTKPRSSSSKGAAGLGHVNKDEISKKEG